MNKSQVRHLELLDWKTEKVRDVENWAKHHKPYLVYPEKGLHSSAEKHLFYLIGKHMGKGNYANLGTWGGASAACLAYGIKEAGQGGTIYAVDVFSINKVKIMPTRIPEHFKKLGLSDHVDLKICKGFTSEWAVKLKDVKFKFILVDADHSYKSCREDYDLWSPLLEVGGEIAFHDCEYEEVDRVLKESLVEPEWKFIRQIWKTMLYRKMK